MDFYAPAGTPKVRFERFDEGVEKAYEYLKDHRHSDFALSLSNMKDGASTPTLNLERKPDVGVLVQLFVPEHMSPEGEDGWYNLVEPANLDKVSIKDVSTVYQEPNRKDMVETRLSEGVLFSRHMYVPPSLALDALKFYLETPNLSDALRKKPWKFVGLI